MRTVRTLLGAAGLAALTTGVVLLLTDTREGTVPELALWLAGSVAVHDALLVPLVLLCGLALRRAPARTVWRGALLTAGALTLLALPMVLRAGAAAGKPSLLPLDYPANWALTVAGTAVATAGVLLVRASRAAWSGRRRRNGRP